MTERGRSPGLAGQPALLSWPVWDSVSKNELNISWGTALRDESYLASTSLHTSMHMHLHTHVSTDTFTHTYTHSYKHMHSDTHVHTHKHMQDTAYHKNMFELKKILCVRHNCTFMFTIWPWKLHQNKDHSGESRTLTASECKGIQDEAVSSQQG